jgi:hypothetical protein
MSDVFQNTIANYSAYTRGGVQSLVVNDYQVLNFDWKEIVSKNINSSEGSGFIPEQNGIYFVNFKASFENGDSRQYIFNFFVNDVLVSQGQTRIFMQGTNIIYELSTSTIISLKKNDKLDFRIKLDGASIPTTDLEIKDIDVAVYNLEQNGIH